MNCTKIVIGTKTQKISNIYWQKFNTKNEISFKKKSQKFSKMFGYS